MCSGSLVVMTSALHAEGREFNPRPEYSFVIFLLFFLLLFGTLASTEQPVWPSGKATAS